MPCDYNHKEWSYTFSANSRGGFGVRVYDGSANVVPNTDLRPVLWDQTTNGAQEPPRTYGEGYIQFFLNNEEIAFTMNAGETYLMWLWIWGHADQSGEVLGTFGDPLGSFTDFGLSATLPWIAFFS